MKIWTCGSSPRSGTQNAWTRIKNVKGAIRLSNIWNSFGAINPKDFLSRLVTMDETCLYHYDPATKQQSMEWRHSGSPRPKKFRVQKSAGNVFASIFWHLAPSDYHLFPGLKKKKLKGCHFSSDAEVIAAVETWLDGQPSEFFFEWLAILEQRLRSVFSFVGSMLNKSQVWLL